MDHTAPRLALIELPDRDGRARRLVDVTGWPLSLGRALDNSLVLDDPHVAARHVELVTDDAGQLWLRVAHQAINPVWMGRQRIAAGQQAPVPVEGALITIGRQQLRLRLPAETLPAELPLSTGRRGGLMLAVVALALLGLETFERWLQMEPGSNFTQWLPWLLGLPAALAFWCGAWALGSKLFRHGFDFLGHLRVALPALLAISLLQALLPLVAATFDWPSLWRISQAVLPVCLIAWLVHQHLLQVVPQRPRAVSALVGGLLVLGLGVNMAINHYQSGQLLREAYMRTLPLPMLRLGGTVPVPSLVEGLAPMKQVLADRVAQDLRNNPDGDDDANILE